MHNMGKKIGELYALLIEYEKGLPKKPATPQVIAIQGGRIQKANKKSLNAKGKGKGKGKGKDKSYIPKPKNPKPYVKEHPAKDDSCHHFKEVGHGKRNCHAYLAELIKKQKQVGIASSSDYEFSVSNNYVLYFNVIPSDGVYEINMLNLVPNVNSIYNDSYFITFTDDYSHYGYVSLLKHKHEVFETFKVFKNESRKSTRKDYKGTSIRSRRRIHSRNRTLLDMVRSMMNLTTLPLSFWDYALETATRILNMVPTKKVDKTPYKLWYGKVPNLSYLKIWGCEVHVKRDTPNKLQQRSVKCIFIGYPKETIEVNRRAKELKEIQDKDTSPSENTSEIPMEVEGFKPPQDLGDLNEPNNYKAAILDMESDRSKWLFKKKIDMNGIAHTYKACLVAKGYTQTYGVDYEETFSPIADIRAIRIHIAIAAFYDYEIWQIDVKIAFLNGYLNEDIYMVQPEGASTPEEVKHMQNVLYASAVGYAHWTAMKTILKYLRNTEDMFLVYGGNPEAELRVDCYCDAGFETDKDDIKSQTRYVFILNGGAVDWKSSKQNTTAMSATEAEYIDASEAAMEAVWIRKFISGLGIVPIINETIKIFYDNSAALLIANEQGV
ncbi:retrotransposon protein, putative, ty1-copia subclass [Tanacetum coccineum]